MNKKVEKTKKYKIFIVGALIEVALTVIFIFVFAAIIYFFGLNKNYSVIFATLSVAFGSGVAAFYLGYKIKEKGLVIGAITGFITFIIIFVISFIMDFGTVTANTLFHFVIFILSGCIGGITGVNKAINKKYI